MKISPHPLRRRSAAARAAATLLVLLCEIGILNEAVMAGDILRGGATSGAPVGASNPTGTLPPAIAPTGGSTRDSLARTAQAIQAMQAMQLAARNVANQGASHAIKNPSGKGGILPDVPNGLGKGGLQVDPGVTGSPADPLWTGANLPTQTTTSGGTSQVTIKQTAQQAVLNWETFNVGKNTALIFDQSQGGANAGQWIAFNKVNDPMANPSQILGSIKAEGQVYVINRNGIIFGGSSQVNVHAMVASTLSINDNLVKQGLLNNPNNEFLFSGLGGPADSKVGDVIVEAGAQLTAPTSADKVGGRIALIGANVVNEGTISTTDGQTILAAGLQVGWAAHASSDPSLRGLDTAVGAVVDPASTLVGYAGTVTNNGIIDAGRANVTMVGKDVRQLGAITSTTSVSFNGRIDLLANYNAIGNPGSASTLNAPNFVNKATGTVTLGEGSVTQILPELDSKDTVIGSSLALRSQINIQGQQVHFADNSFLYAPNANVAVDAGTWNTGTPSGTGTVTYGFLHNTGQINVDNGAVIDVSGSKNVQSSVASNIVAVELRGSELADSPLLRDGALRGQTIYIDITKTGVYNGKAWVGTPLADVSGYVNLIQRTVGELTAAGGTVKFNAGGAVVIRDGATVDVSGGTINYAGGVVQTSRVYAGKQVFDVADATPDRVYDGVYKGGSISTSKAWGVTEQYTNPLTLNGTRYQEGFVQGGNGGTLNITGGAVAVDGSLKGSTYTGVRQRSIGPVASSLSISLTSERLVASVASPFSPNGTDVVFSNANTQAPLGDYSVDSNGNPLDLPQERIDKLILSSDLLGEGGFGNLSVRTPNGDISVERGVTLQTTPRGSISLAGANVDIQGALIAAGGSLSVTTYNTSPDKAEDLRQNGGTLPAADPDRGHFTLGGGAILSTAGYLVDDRPASSTLLQTPMVTTGGKVTISSLSADLATGSLIDVSGGVVATGGGKYTYGNAGSISLLTGLDPGLAGVSGGQLTLGGQLKGMSGAKGGSLTVQAPTVQVGGDSAPVGALHLGTDFFNQGGFSSFTVNGVGSNSGPAMVIAAGTRLAPVTQSWIASEVDGAISLTAYVKDAGLQTPLSLTFGAPGLTNGLNSALIARGDVLIQAGATIDAGVKGTITLNGQTDEVHGTLLAAGGSIVVSGASKEPLLNSQVATQAGTTVLIGSEAVLSTAGTTLLVPDSFGRRRGAVLDGGTINVTGNVVAQAGAVMDVSGTSGILDLLPGESGQSLADLQSGGTTSKPYQIRGKSTRIESDGGTITFSGGEMLYTDATLKGSAGGASATGGTLAISSGGYVAAGLPIQPSTPTFGLIQSGNVMPSTYTAGIGQTTFTDASGIAGGARFAVDRFTAGGFDNLDLGGVIKAVGAVSIKADGRVTLGSGPVLYADSTLAVNASHVVLGAPFKTPRQPQDSQDDYLVNNIPVRMLASYGTGSLSISGDLIDVGDLSLQGIGKASLVANNGDIRGSGTLAIAGDLALTAGQIYPPTALQFTLAAFDYQSGGVTHAGSVTITGSGKRSLPLSAGGTLAVYASNIVQNGTLRAPFGKIILGWDGTGAAPFDHLTGANAPKTASVVLGANSVTSVSAIDPITGKGVVIPFGVSLDGTTWLDPSGKDITNGGLPQKSITLSGDSVVSEKGSQVDIRGGGDLFAYRFVAGNGGSTDILASSGSFAIIPGYSAAYAPYAPYSTLTGDSGSGAALSGDAGYVNGSMQVGQQVYLDASAGVPAGVYTLLPARYALLPGAYLVTPQSGAAVGTVPKADGSKIVSGYQLSGLDDGVSAPAVRTRFEVASAKVVNARAEYTQFLANTFLTSTGGFRLPGDSGQLVLSATRAMAIGGQVLSAASGDFRGGLIDISSAGNILISNGAPASSPEGTLVIDANLLSGFGAESLLIGGIRSAASDGTLVAVTTGNVTLDNAGAALTGPEIILAAKGGVTLADGAQIKQSGKTSNTADTLIIGDTLAAGATPTGSGNGALVRVNHGNTGSLVRRDVVVGQGSAAVSIGTGALLQGDGVTLDSTGSTSIGSGATLIASNLALSSGRISLSLDSSVTPGADAGLVLSSDIIRELASSSSLSLSSYSSIDLLGSGVVGGTNGAGKPTIDSLSLHAAAIRGIGVGSGSVEFDAGQIEIGGLAGSVAPSGPAESSGLLTFRSTSLRLGSGALDLRGFSQVNMAASKEVRTTANGSLSATGGLTLNTPLVTSDATVKYAVTSAGALQLTGSGGTSAVTTAGLGSSLSLTGSSVDLSSRIVLPSGVISVTATSGDLNIGVSLEAGGIAQRFKGQTRYTNGGAIHLTAGAGDITLAAGGSLDVSAKAGGGDAGSVILSAKNGSVDLQGSINGKGSTSGKNGSFALQVAKMPSLAAFDSLLDTASFTESREYRVTTGDVAVDGVAHAHSYTVSTDQGSIAVTGSIDASGKEGGSVRLVANRDLTVAAGSSIDASGDDFSSAGKGGSVTLETRGASGGMLNLAQGASIDLSVATNKGAGSAKAGDFTGVLHLRAPRISNGGDIAVGSLDSTVTGASQVIVEGYQAYDLTSSGGAISTAVQNQVKTDATAFMSNADAIESRILAGSSSNLGSILTVRPGAEIVNTTGDLTLGTSSSTSTSDWNLATYRFGGEQVPGILTLRSAGNLVFYNTLSDGFATSTYTSGLLANNAALADNAESWSFRLVSGADFSAADARQVIPVKVADSAALGSASGSVKIGKNAGIYASTKGTAALTSEALNTYFQVIRTGSGDIDVMAAGDVQLLNPFASIYTAGTQTSDPTLGGAFANPVTLLLGNLGRSLGSVQQSSQAPIQFTLGGGDVSVSAGNDIIHLTRYTNPATGLTSYVQDSQREMPVNWLYRRGYVNPATGEFGTTRSGEVGSTAWWVDFTNFFDGVAALGGGNVTLAAGRDVSNVDASTPTNARMPGGKPDASKLVELGGGDVTVIAGRDVNAGVYYVERGKGSLTAGDSIVTNATRAPVTSGVTPADTALLDPDTWLPTTLFVGKSSFEVTAGNEALLGPVANVFLLPQGLNNSPYNKTWFSTYSQEAGVTAVAYGGDITLRQAVTLPGGSESTATLQAWFDTQLLLSTSGLSSSYFQPWLRLAETSVEPFAYAFTLMPGTLKLTSFGGDVNLAGRIDLSPSPTGTLEILAANAINGLRPTGVNLNGNRSWTPAVLNLSDADPSALPGITTPFAYQQLVGTLQTPVFSTQSAFLQNYANLFQETGSTDGVLQERQTRHSTINDGTGNLVPLHFNDRDPVLLYSGSGDISGLTLFSAKPAEILAGQDLRDISFYIQNVRTTDVSIVSASRDIIAYDQGTSSRVESQASGNELSVTYKTAAGDIQISGQGALEVFAGRNLDLGTGLTNADGTGSGITSIGNGRNPYLTFAGAEIITAAGFDATSLAGSKADFATFITKFVNTDDGATRLKELGLTAAQFAKLDGEAQNEAVLKLFFLVLRDTGRHHNDPNNEDFGTYKEGQNAIATLFPGTGWKGDIDTRSRNIRTRNGGDITIFAPGGSLRLAQSVIGSPLVPPGIITEAGGNINIATDKDVNLGVSRIFTLRGGNEIIWSTHGDIAAGSSSKTIQSAPPTRVLIDPQSGDVKTDLAGLATGGGIGVLSTVAGVKAADVDLIAPEGTIDAGDAGIRVTGNINLAGAVIANAGNITAGGTSSGASSGASAPSLGALTSASNAAAAATANETNTPQQNQTTEPQVATVDTPSDISVEVVGYGGDETDSGLNGGTGTGSEDEEEKKRRKRQQEESRQPAESGETVTPPGH